MMDRVRIIEELTRDECRDGKPELKPYRDSVRSEKHPNGILTIGIGRNLEDKGISLVTAYQMAHEDVDGDIADLDYALPWWTELDEVRQRVLVNMCFNLGIHRLLGFKQMLAALKLKLWERAADEMKSSGWHVQVGVRALRLEMAMRTGVMPR